MTLTDLADEMDAVSAKLTDGASEIAKKVASTILEDLSQVTPVDTGEALSNWQVSVDAPMLAAIPAHVASPRGRMRDGVWTHTVDPQVTRGANAPPTLDAGLLLIEAKLPGEPIFISNSVDQIEILDSGSSNQAPAGFVDRAVILGRNVVEKTKLL
jgi:hypothetical protein